MDHCIYADADGYSVVCNEQGRVDQKVSKMISIHGDKQNEERQILCVLSVQRNFG